MSRCWCETEGIQISECSGASHWSWGPDITLCSKVLGWLRSRSITRISIYRFRWSVVHLPLVIGFFFPSQGLPSKNARTLWVWLAWRMAMDCLWRRSLSPKNPGEKPLKEWVEMAVFLCFFCCFCQDVCLFSFPLTGVFLKNWFTRGGTCEIFTRLRFDSFTQKLP